VSALNVGSHDAIEETFLTEEETFVILAALFQRNGADMMGSNDELLTLFNRRIKVRIIRKLLKKNNQLLGELKLAQTFASEIQQISQLLGIHGNLATKIRREDPLREFSTDDLTWLSDFQANNPDCPDNLRALVAQCRPSLKQTRQHDAREQQWTTKDMRLVPASQRASQQFTKYDVAFASTLPRTQKDTFFSKMTFFVIAKRAIRVGDKVAGRHGNKGVVSLILPQPLMPYIQDGTSIDLILNPLGVPSRMNVGQLFECLLGLASRFLNQIWQITAFDELHEYGQVVDLECVDAKDVGSHRVASHPGQLEDAVVDVDVVATHRRPTSHQLTHQTNELYGKFAGYADVMGNPPRRPHRPKSLTKYRVAKASSVLRNVASYKVGWGRCEATTNEHRWTNATRPSNQLPRHPKHYRRYERDEAPRLGSPSRRHVKVISKAFVYRQLYQAQLKAGYDWLIQPNQSCKQYVFDGRTGEVFPQQVTCGISYILKLNHLVEDKIHARSIGPYSMISQQPLQGKKRDGGQRLGEMEMWALGGYSAAFVLQECLTYKSDDKKHRADVWKLKIPRNFKRLQNKTHPEATHVLFSYFRALCLDGIHIKL
jgi:DNA-directed RNA polymerase beta subunit